MAKEDTKKETEEDKKTAEAVEEVKKAAEEDDGKILIHIFNRAPTVPNCSPFGLKLETFLRVAGLEYKCDHKKPMSPKTKKSPWIEYEGKSIADTTLILETLAEKFESANIDSGLSPEQVGVARAFRMMLEERFIYTMMRERFSKANKPTLAKTIMKLPGVPNFLQGFVRNLMASKMLKRANATGLGVLDDATVTKWGIDDLAALSKYLGNKPFIFGNDVTTVDCIMFAFLAQILYAIRDDCPLRLAIVDGELTNLKEHTERMKEKYWSDWDDLLVKQEPKPAKKDKSKKKDNKADDKDKKEDAEDKKEDKDDKAEDKDNKEDQAKSD